jgi:predicted tellurium resistance membrane protein TerC
MELFSSPWWSALLAIVLIDLVLAGDNAIVIALAARNLPDHLQKKAILWGTVGAIIVRTGMTVCVVWMLQIPGLMLVGGLGLIWIAYKLLADSGEEEGHDDMKVRGTRAWGQYVHDAPRHDPDRIMAYAKLTRLPPIKAARQYTHERQEHEATRAISARLAATRIR